MAQTILVPIDASPWSASAVDTALKLAEHTAEPVHLVGLHVVNVTHLRGRWLADLAGLIGFEPVVVPSDVEAHFRSHGAQLLEAFAARCRAAGTSHEVCVDQGGVVDRIAHHAHHHDLVIMGVRGETADRFPGQGGSTVSGTLRRVSANTLVVTRQLATLGPVALGYDGSAGAGCALRAVARLCDLASVPVHVLQVVPSADAIDQLPEARRHLEQRGIEVHTHRVTGEAREALPAEAVRLGCTVLAMGYRGRSRVRDVFLGRTTEWLVGRVALDLLIAR